MRNSLSYFLILLLLTSCAKKLGDRTSVQSTSHETIFKLDVNKDGKIDSIWARDSRNPQAQITLWRKDDLNFDGKFDLEQYYTFGKLSSEKMDLDFDGIFDALNYYNEGIISKSEYSLNSNGRIDMWLHYKNGKLVKKEVDTTKSGKPDYFEFYKDSKIDRIGRDIDGDGIIDSWE